MFVQAENIARLEIMTSHEANKLLVRVLINRGANRSKWMERARRTKAEHPEWRALISSQVRYAREENRGIVRYLRGV